MKRIGVFICHCGSNIAATVDCAKVAEAASAFPGVIYSADYKYMCSEPGQEFIKDAIKKYDLNAIVVASCTPRMHEPTFRKTLASGGLNPYMFEMTNLREQCSWVHADIVKATEKAIDLVKMSAAKVNRNEALYSTTIPVHKKALVIGAGIAGMQAALDIADAGHQVVLVDREPTIGGKMPMLDKTFPTMDCSACISTPKMVEAAQHPNIELMAYSEVVEVDGFIGNFTVKIRQKAKYVDHHKCTGCGLCETKCPQKVPNEYDLGLGTRACIYKPFAQAVPNKPVIDPRNCRKLVSGKCGLCAKVCPTGAVNYEDTDTYFTDTFGAIVMATGYDLYKWEEVYGEYGYGKFADVVTGLHFERMVNASGPTSGKIKRPSDGKEPKSVVFIKCVGSREPAKAKRYCSRACCMYTAKHAHQVLDKIPDANVYVFYMDVRTPGKGYDEFYEATLKDGAYYLRGRVSKIYQEGDKLIVKGEDSLIGKQVQVAADMVVLATAMVPSAGSRELAQTVGFLPDLDGWYQEAHPKLRPVETPTAGVFLAGACQGPKDIPDTVAQAGAAAAKVCGLLSKSQLETNPMTAKSNPSVCSGCGMCIPVCPYKAIQLTSFADRDHHGNRIIRNVASVNSGLCQGCGACTVTCRPGAIDLQGFKNDQILEEVDALWR
ncbi:CoB--CoM heterodisulfide reductase iron-sulfur subunit A family protein [bacterium BFN5]|nr:CoB--CoM heterodisulfide reductase iron-sulfur subunit A family protein [bacterium BFN5]QJW45148.1 CoB--CoM heterodisulfide reductase iron-sulfur subunit A family protein [bacterium BFN5]